MTGSGYYVENISAFSPDKKSRQSHNIQHSSRQSGKTFDYTFSYGNLDYNCYHSRAWRKCLTNAWDMISMADTASYQMSQGSYTLRSLITEYLYMSRGVNCTPEQIILTSGHQRSIDIITHIFSSSDYSFAMEDPGYNGTWEIVSQSPFRIIPIPLEDDGVSIEHIQRLRDTLLYVTPSHQFPMGSILPISKRLELIEWAVQSGSYIIEDDYDSELRYQSRPIPSLQSIDNSGRTIYLGTFSKSMSPDLRISYMVLPEKLMKDYSSRYSHTNCTVPTVLQLALIEFIQSGNYQRHIGAMKNHYNLMEELNCDTVFTIPLFGGIPIYESVVVTWIIMAVILLLCLILVRGLRVENPSRKQVVLELAVSKLYGFFEDTIGENGKAYIPYLAAVAIYIGIANLIGLLGFKPPTKDMNVTVALALMSIILIEAAGVRKKGTKGWLKSFAEPMPVVLPINILEIFIKPLSLCMRLFGNVLGSFVIMELLKMVVPPVLPAIFSCYFDIFDGLIQAYVFVFLTGLFIKEATE